MNSKMITPSQEPIPFSYDPLNSPREIRLMLLHAGNEEEVVSCTLQRVLLPDASHSVIYEALSYAWGNARLMTQISCNGQLLSVTRDLNSALQRLRQPNKALMLWFDQICINQDDPSERSKQVQLMRDIYQQARSVLIWLGDAEVNHIWKMESDKSQDMAEDTPGSLSETLKSVDSLTDKLIEPSRRESSLLLGPLNMGSYGSPVEHDMRWRALSRILVKPWFSRMWILQEVALSKHAVILYGQERMPWLRLTQLLSLIDKSPPLRHWFLERCEAVSAALYSVYTIEYLRSSTSLDFLGVLNLSRDQEATDPRDKIFAVLGFYDQSTGSIVPDYVEPIESVLTNTARQQISGSKSLKALNYTHIPARLPSLPSWVPDWTNGREYTRRRRSIVSTSLFNACGSRTPSFAWDHDERHLIVAATIVDSLPCTPGTFIQFADRDPSEVAECLAPCIELAKNRKPATPDKTPKETFWRSLIGNSVDLGELKIPDPAWGQKIGRYIKTFKVSKYISDRTLSEHKSRRQILRWHPIKWAQFHRYVPRDPRQLYEEIGRVNDAIARIAAGRAFVSTSKGRLGWVPESCQPGDLVAIIHGNQVPFVVRRHGECWKLIGDSYIHSVMQGEAMVEGHETVHLTLC